MIYILSLSVNRRLLSDEICHQVGVFDVSCGNDVLRSDFLTLYCPNAKISVLLFAPVPAYFSGALDVVFDPLRFLGFTLIYWSA